MPGWTVWLSSSKIGMVGVVLVGAARLARIVRVAKLAPVTKSQVRWALVGWSR